VRRGRKLWYLPRLFDPVGKKKEKKLATNIPYTTLSSYHRPSVGQTRTTTQHSSTHPYSYINMCLQLHTITSPSEFTPIWPMHFAAFSTPYNPYSKYFNPIHTTLSTAIEASKNRHIQTWKANPACHWIKVVEAESGEVVGAACWNVNVGAKEGGEEKGKGEGEKEKRAFEAYWHISGSEEKVFAEKLIGGLRMFVAEKMGVRPHLGLLLPPSKHTNKQTVTNLPCRARPTGRRSFPSPSRCRPHVTRMGHQSCLLSQRRNSSHLRPFRSSLLLEMRFRMCRADRH
jgi:hypothetical protein